MINRQEGYVIVKRENRLIVAKGTKRALLKKIKELNKAEEKSHCLGASYRLNIGDTWGA
jgi:hypothetical protein